MNKQEVIEKIKEIIKDCEIGDDRGEYFSSRMKGLMGRWDEEEKEKRLKESNVFYRTISGKLAAECPYCKQEETFDDWEFRYSEGEGQPKRKTDINDRVKCKKCKRDFKVRDIEI